MMKTLAELKAMKDKVRRSVEIREHAEAETRILVGMATCGIAAGARPVLTAFVEEMAKREIGNVMVTQTGCKGDCEYEPIVEVLSSGKEKVTYGKVNPEMVQRIVEEHIIGGNVVTEYTIGAAGQ